MYCSLLKVNVLNSLLYYMMVISGRQRWVLSLPSSNNLSSRKYFFKSFDGGTSTPGPLNGQKVLTRCLSSKKHVPDGLVARIRRFHRRGPGSIPGQGTKLLKTVKWFQICVSKRASC